MPTNKNYRVDDKGQGQQMPIDENWGVIEPVKIDSSRVRLDLGLSRATRFFNELSFPGIGGAFFVRQLTWSTIGLRLQEDVEHSAMRAAEAVEALASYIALRVPGNAYKTSNRVRGRRKLGPGAADFSFDRLSRRANYVSQPLRVGTGAALVGLGLAEGSAARFNGLELTDAGRQLANSVLNLRANPKRSVGDWLVDWMRAEAGNIPDGVKRALLAGARGSDDDTPTAAERGNVRALLIASPLRKVMVDALRETRHWFEVEGDDIAGIASPQGQAALLGAVKDDAQRAYLKAALAYERLCQQSLTILEEVGQRAADARRSGLHNTLDVATRHHAALLDALEECADALRNEMTAAGVVQRDVIAFCSEQHGPLHARLRCLIGRSKDYVALVGGVVVPGRLFRGKPLRRDDEAPDDDASDILKDARDDALPQRLWRAHYLVQDIYRDNA